MNIPEYIKEYIKMLPSGVLGIAAAVFLYLALSCLLRVKGKWWHRGLLLLGCWVTSFMIIYIGDIVNLSCNMVLFLAVLWITCEGSGLKKLTLGLMFASAVFAFNAFYDNCVGLAAHFYGKDVLYADMYLVGRLWFAVFMYLAIRRRKPEPEFELSRPLWRLMLLLAFPPMGIMLSTILLRSPFYAIKGTVLSDAFLFLMVMLSFIGLLRAFAVLERQQRMERENMLVHQNKRYYEAMEQQQFEIRRIRHDLSNHLQTILSLPGQQREDYVRELLDGPAFGRVLSWCGDPTVNAVLTAKETLARQKGIRFLARVDIREGLPFDKADVCAVFANALDNAVEGCMGVGKQQREIRLEARAGKGVLAVKIRNTCPDMEAGEAKGRAADTSGRKKAGMEKALGKGHFPKTTKGDVKNHGFGLRSIQETVKKYGGSMEIDREGQFFRLFLYLPFEQDMD